jgi:hypothetical protein
MTSRPRSSRGALTLAALVAGCGGGVHDLSVASYPLLVIHGHVDLSTLRRQHPSAPLIGALIWAAIPRVSRLCLESQNADFLVACPDPYGLFAGELEKAAPVDADGNFDLQLFHLPKASVSVGDEVTRIAYGSLLVAEDIDGNGQLSFPPRPDWRGDMPSTDTVALQPDVVVAASFSTLRADQVRVVFREGGFVADSNFYPSPGCPTPPTGFSLLAVPAYSGEAAAPGTCVSSDIGTLVEVPALSPAAALALTCRPSQQDAGVVELHDDHAPRADAKPVCLSHEIVAEMNVGVCTSAALFALKGCRDGALCETPEWDLTASPPEWWPCP